MTSVPTQRESLPMFWHRHVTRAGTPPGSARSVHARNLVDWRASLRRADRACYCPGRPTVVVIMPPAGARPAVDLLFCRHHYRIHAQALAAAGAVAFDREGVPLTPDTLRMVPAGC